MYGDYDYDSDFGGYYYGEGDYTNYDWGYGGGDYGYVPYIGGYGTDYTNTNPDTAWYNSPEAKAGLGLLGAGLGSYLAGGTQGPYGNEKFNKAVNEMQPWGQPAADTLMSMYGMNLSDILAGKYNPTPGLSPIEMGYWQNMANQFTGGGTPSEQQSADTYSRIMQASPYSYFPKEYYDMARGEFAPMEAWSRQDLANKIAEQYGPVLGSYGRANQAATEGMINLESELASKRAGLDIQEADALQRAMLATPQYAMSAAGKLPLVTPSMMTAPSILSFLGVPRMAQEAQDQQAYLEEQANLAGWLQMLNLALGYPASQTGYGTYTPQTPNQWEYGLAGLGSGLAQSLAGNTVKLA